MRGETSKQQAKYQSLKAPGRVWGPPGVFTVGETLCTHKGSKQGTCITGVQGKTDHSS